MKTQLDPALYDVVTAPPATGETGRGLSLGLPKGLGSALVAGLGAYLLLMLATFGTANGLGIVFVICGICLAGYAGVPWLCGRASGRVRLPTAEPGLEMQTGRVPASEAWTLVLLMPGLMLVWGVAVAIIRATL
jgi:hypothetical protein